MSQQNVEIVRSAYEALNAGKPDYSIFDPALIYHPRADEPDPSAHVGRDAFERLLDGFLESFRDLRVDVLEVIDAGDRVIASTRIHGRGAASGASVEDAYVNVYRLRDGLVVEGWEYRTEQEALEAVGLAEAEDSN
jgi:ketosteroid isomerase-like protein